jgi:hypothetical protein
MRKGAGAGAACSGLFIRCGGGGLVGWVELTAPFPFRRGASKRRRDGSGPGRMAASQLQLQGFALPRRPRHSKRRPCPHHSPLLLFSLLSRPLGTALDLAAGHIQ